MDSDVTAEIASLRARVAALEFAIDIEREDERRRAVKWALDFEETPAGIDPAPQVLSRTEDALRRYVSQSAVIDRVGRWPWTVAKSMLFASWCDASDARSVVDHLRQRAARWSDYTEEAKEVEF